MEILGEDSAVFLPAEDPEAWQAAIRKLLADPTLGDQLGDAARQKVEAYTWVARAKKSMAGLES